jgi:hypothetical protein
LKINKLMLFLKSSIPHSPRLFRLWNERHAALPGPNASH